MAKSELSASMQKDFVSQGDIRTRAVVTASLSASKASCSLVFQVQGLLDFVRSNRG